MRKLQSNLQREIEGYMRAGYSRDAAILEIRRGDRRGIDSLLNALDMPKAS